MRAGKPSRPVQFCVIEAKLTHQLRMLRASPLDSLTDVENAEPVSPVAHVNQAIHNLNVVQIASTYERVVTVLDFLRHGVFNLPARDLFWILRILEIDNAKRAGRVIRQIDVVAVDI